MGGTSIQVQPGVQARRGPTGQGDRSAVNQVARELGLSHETLRNWVKQDRVDQGQGEPGELTTGQLEELRQLRRRSSS
jgi:transposase-like protein